MIFDDHWDYTYVFRWLRMQSNVFITSLKWYKQYINIYVSKYWN